MARERAGRRVYLDASAAVKLVVTEVESAELQDFIGRVARMVSSELLKAEVVRAVRRHSAAAGWSEDELHDRTTHLLKRFDLVAFDDQAFALAGRLNPASLRVLDALHVASALQMPPLEAFISYDARQLRAATAAGLPTASPGAA